MASSLTAITPYNTVVYLTDDSFNLPVAVTATEFQAKCLCESLNRLYPNYKRAKYIVWEPTW